MSVSADTFTFVSTLVRRESAIQLGPGKEYLIESRLLPLAREAGIHGVNAVDQFVRRLRQQPERGHLVRVVEALTTNETSWFRDGAPFTALRDTVLPEVRRANPGQLRIWSAACSTGQEPYSIAMTLLEAGEQRFSILATDLSNEVLARAEEGLYSQLEVNRGLPASMLVRYFCRAGAGWRVNAHPRALVSFRQHNLLEPPPGDGPFDIVFLRNVLIYFDAATKRDVLARLRRVVRPGGYLVLGAAESTLGMDANWDRVDATRASIHRLRGGNP